MSGTDEHKASEWEPGLGSFVLGIAVGVTLGLLFAREDGGAFRAKVARRLRALRELAADKAEDLGAIAIDVASGEDEDPGATPSHGAGRRRRP